MAEYKGRLRIDVDEIAGRVLEKGAPLLAKAQRKNITSVET